MVHVASPVSFSPNPQDVIPTSIAGAMNALKAANKSPSVKRFVLTGSGTAVLVPKPEQEGIEVSSESWNDESVESAWTEGGDAALRPYHVYAASKVESERAVWNFQRSDPRRRADLVVNTGDHHGKNSRKDKNLTSANYSTPQYQFWKDFGPASPRPPFYVVIYSERLVRQKYRSNGSDSST